MKDAIDKYQKFMELYRELKRHLRQVNPQEYERWKAGGFLIDGDILSHYPTLGEALLKNNYGEDDPDDEAYE